MQRHKALTTSRDIGAAMTLSIRSGSLRNRDILDMDLPSGQTKEVMIDRFDVTGLHLIMDDKRFVCRPWCNGDGPVSRLPGTSSNWTVERIDDRLPADA